MAGEPAPELELTVDPKRLAAEPELKAHPFLAHTHRCLEAPPDQDLGQVRVAAILSQPAHMPRLYAISLFPLRRKAARCGPRPSFEKGSEKPHQAALAFGSTGRPGRTTFAVLGHDRTHAP